ncbi:amidohydrolase family protein [Chitinilyticum aquatile]|uniref:amidohydrolase family protein n=1 Tax=Chitinilyticum aquatile TaxID=362520 RepID=UPI0003FE8CBF|nr:amidohydrolase family protein [Chitinilyticum aquatile]
MKTLLGLLFCLFLGSACAQPLALSHARLIDGTGAPPRDDVTLLLRDGRIEAIQPAGPLPAGYREVNLKGLTILPGFINAHVHGAYTSQNLKDWLQGGVTSVRDLGTEGQLENGLERNALKQASGHARLIAATPLIGPAGGYGSVFVNSKAEGIALVERAHRLGYDLIKLTQEDNLQGRNWQVLPPDTARAMASRARALGMPVAVHISHARLLPQALDIGATDFAHMVVEPLPMPLAERIAAQGIIWVPTLELWQGVQQRHGINWGDVAVANTGVFFRTGGKIALGTDFGGYITPFDRGFPRTEVLLLQKAGLAPMDIIVAGTRNAAEASGRLADLGTIEPGKRADLLVVSGDPLADIRALFTPAQVWLGGEQVRPAGR